MKKKGLDFKKYAFWMESNAVFLKFNPCPLVTLQTV